MKIELDKNAFCLSCNLERFHYLQKCFDAVGLKSPSLFPGAVTKIGAQGCILGHLSMVMMARCLNLPYLVVYEDDAYPRPDVVTKFDLLINKLETIDFNWGILVLGRNGEFSAWNNTPELFWSMNRTDAERNSHKSLATIIEDDFISIPRNSNGSHAYIVNRCCYNEWLRSLLNNRYSDLALGQNNFKYHKVYWTKELLFCQKQIDEKCMTKFNNMSGIGTYIYPYNYNRDFSGSVYISKQPPDGFVDDLLSYSGV